MSEITQEVGAEVVMEEHQEIEDEIGEQDVPMKEAEQTNDGEMEEAFEEVTPREEKKESEAEEEPAKDETTVAQAIDEVSDMIDKESALPQEGGAVHEEGMDSLKEPTPAPLLPAEEDGGEAAATVQEEEQVQSEVPHEGGEEMKVAEEAKVENGDAKPQAEEEDSKLPAEDAKPPAQATADGPPPQNDGIAHLGDGEAPLVAAAAAATAASGIKDATAATLVVLKQGPDGQTVAVMPPLQPTKHVKKGEVLKRPQNSTTVVTRNGKTWSEMLDALVAYKAEHGDCYVPDRYKNDDGVCLGLWVRNQRRRETSLTDEQHKRLTELGLDWQTQNERFDNVWHERYAKLTMYRVEHGDCKVPYTYKADPALAKWVSQQRAQQAQGRLAADRKAKLDAIDFSWKLNTVKNRNTKTEDKKWTRQYDKLIAFHQANGHCKVPDRYKPDRPLGTWVKKQRLANACHQLKEDRKKMLDDLGFVWRITDKTDGEKWDKMFTKLKEYKEENGTCHVSRTVPDSDLKPLARWVKTQRALYKSGKILPDRQERLETIDFVWDGTQLPIKRKRRRSTEGDDKSLKVAEMPPIKRAKAEDTDGEKKASAEDTKGSEKKLAAKRVLPMSSQKTDASLHITDDDEEAKGAAVLKEMGDAAYTEDAKLSSSEKVEAAAPANTTAAENGNAEGNVGEKANESSSLAQPAVNEVANGAIEGKAEAMDEGDKPSQDVDDTVMEGSSSAVGKPTESASPPRRSRRNMAATHASAETAGGESTDEDESVTVMI